MYLAFALSSFMLLVVVLIGGLITLTSLMSETVWPSALSGLFSSGPTLVAVVVMASIGAVLVALPLRFIGRR